MPIRWATSAAFFTLACALLACNGIPAQKPLEVKRLSSNTGAFDAVLFEYPASAIDEHALILSIVPKGAAIPAQMARHAKDFALLIAEGLNPSSLTWSSDDHQISIRYEAGKKIFFFKNYAWMNVEKDKLPWAIEVLLERVPASQPKTIDPPANP